MDADREAEAEEAIELRDALIAGLAGAASDLDETAGELLRAATWLPWQKRLMIGLAVAQTAIFAAFAIGLAVLIDIAQTNRDNTTATKHTTDAIESCTLPQGVCYQANQTRTASAVAVLQKYTLIAVECGHAGSDRAIEACVARKAVEQGLVK